MHKRIYILSTIHAYGCMSFSTPSELTTEVGPVGLLGRMLLNVQAGLQGEQTLAGGGGGTSKTNRTGLTLTHTHTTSQKNKKKNREREIHVHINIYMYYVHVYICICICIQYLY